MALNPRDVSITRDQVAAWKTEAKKKRIKFATYLERKVGELNLPDRAVRMGDEDRDIVDLILDDLDSYA